jgi:hypothetical protein
MIVVLNRSFCNLLSTLYHCMILRFQARVTLMLLLTRLIYQAPHAISCIHLPIETLSPTSRPSRPSRLKVQGKGRTVLRMFITISNSYGYNQTNISRINIRPHLLRSFKQHNTNSLLYLSCNVFEYDSIVFRVN